MARHGIPTARYRVVRDRRPRRARSIASGEFGFPVVLKADGLAAGKGVVVAADRARKPTRAIRAAMDEQQFGAAGARARDRGVPRRPGGVVLRAVRRHARGAARLGAGSQAHLRRRSRARTPAAWARSRRARSLDAALQARIMREIVEPVAARHARRGHRVSAAFSTCGLMLTLRRPEGDRVQRALRRSGGAGGAAAHRRRAAAAAGGGRRRRPLGGAA